MSTDAKVSAAELGRRGGLKGGKARAAKLTPDERAASARAAAGARWALPAATHMGELRLEGVGGVNIPCYVLEDGRRVLSKTGMVGSLAMKLGGQGTTKLGNDRLVRFVSGKGISPYISEELTARITNPVRFRSPNGGSTIDGFEASTLVDLCESVLQARSEGALMGQQAHIAKQCEILVRGFARVGIVALVDEATGYQYDRARTALAEILEVFIAKELAAWVKTFPDDYYDHLFRLRGIQREEFSNKRPQYFGALTNEIVYERLAPGVLNELHQKNPKRESGRRKATHHQWLTPEHGHPKLREHLAKVVALMTISSDYPTFLAHLNTVTPKFGDTYMLPYMVPEKRPSAP